MYQQNFTGDLASKIFFKNRQAIAKPSGTIIISDPLRNREVQADTMQCVHCGKHWISVRGSGKRRGFCQKCMGITCGNRMCDVCNRC